MFSNLAFIISVPEGLHFTEFQLARIFSVVAEVDLVAFDALSGTLQHHPGRGEGAVEGFAFDEARPVRVILFCGVTWEKIFSVNIESSLMEMSSV